MLKSLLNGSRFLVLAAVLGPRRSSGAIHLRPYRHRRGHRADDRARRDFYRWREAIDTLFHRDLRFIPARHRDADHVSLYELFFDSDLKLPARLEIRTFEDLKSNLVTVVIVVMAVTFLGQIVSWNGEADPIGFGVVVALVIAALNFYLWIVKRGKK